MSSHPPRPNNDSLFQVDIVGDLRPYQSQNNLHVKCDSDVAEVNCHVLGEDKNVVGVRKKEVLLTSIRPRSSSLAYAFHPPHHYYHDRVMPDPATNIVEYLPLGTFPSQVRKSRFLSLPPILIPLQPM